MLYLIDYIANGLHFWYKILIIKEISRKPISLHPGLGSSLSNAIYAAGLGRSGGFLHRWFTGSAPTIWHWDGINGNNGAWIGSSRSGLRIYPKSDDPAWQAGVPNDSKVAPSTPESWSSESPVCI